MKKTKKPLVVVLIVCLLVLAYGMYYAYTKPTDKTGDPGSSSSTETRIEQTCAINADSIIADDLDILHITMSAGSSELALADLRCLFPAEDAAYLYYSMPQDTTSHAWRIDQITINGHDYATKLLEVDGNYQKYSITGLRYTDSNEYTEYTITKVHYIDEADGREGQTYNTEIICAVSFADELFTYKQQNHYTITLSGENFRTIFQFNKDNNAFIGLWSKIIADTEQLDLDKRSFFYFAFNCYDTVRGLQFVPDDILELEVEYNRLVYEYAGRDKKAAKNITPARKTITQTIKPDNVKVIAADDKRSNKRIYEYNTINKLSEADLTKNLDSNSELLKQVAKEYDWAVQFGESKGYPEKNTEAGFLFTKTYDISYTDMEDFKTISITYRYEHETVKCRTNSLVRDTITTVELPNTDPTPDEKIEYEREKIIQDPSKNGFEKLIALIWLWLEPLFVKVTLVIAVVTAVYLILPIRPLHLLHGKDEEDD